MPEDRLATGRRWRTIARVVILLVLLLAANLLAREYIETLQFPIRPGNEDAVHRTIMASAVLK